jgi:branched-chain amino acid transport system ATP-binding protein
VPLTFESMSVLDNATIGALLRHHNAREARAKARDVLQRVGLGHLVDAPAKSLGTPGRKRLEIARALASEPKALLLDEAMAGLTPTEVHEAIELVRRIHGGGITIVIVEHIMEVIVSLAHKVVVFHQGREIARGTPREVTSNQAVIEAYLGRRKVRHGPQDMSTGA